MLKLWVYFYVRWIDWKHNVHSLSCINFHFYWFLPQGASRSGESVIDVDLSKEQDEFLSGHAIDGRVLFPATGYLVSWSYINIMCWRIISFDRCSISVSSQVLTYLSFILFCFILFYFILFAFDIIWTIWELCCCGIHWVLVAGFNAFCTVHHSINLYQSPT